MYVLDTTGSATIFASILSIATIPTILLSPLGGILADRNFACMFICLGCV